MAREPDSPSPPFATHSVVGRVRLNEATGRLEYDTRSPIFYDPICEEPSEESTRRAIEEWEQLERMVRATPQRLTLLQRIRRCLGGRID
jgi:hypothetical protein